MTPRGKFVSALAAIAVLLTFVMAAMVANLYLYYR